MGQPDAADVHISTALSRSRKRRKTKRKVSDAVSIYKITRTADYPHGRSIKWPKVYRGLRRRGMDKEKAARISNAASNKYRGGSRQPLSATAGKKPIPEDILDKRPDLRKPGGRKSKAS
jgi:hypothetical protein